MKNKINYKKKPVCIIGVGKVGSALYHTLKHCGYNVQYAIDKNLRRLRIITADDGIVKISDGIKRDNLKNSDIIIFAVNDKSLKSVVKECSKMKLDLSNKIVFHLSGIENSEIFNILNINKLYTGSYHPLQTFNTITYKYSKIINNIYFGLEGGSVALDYFVNLCNSFKSKYVVIKKEKKVLYHCACVIASNFLVSHFQILSNISKVLSLDGSGSIEIFKPIIEETYKNIFKKGTAESLTGPFERGDVNTIDLHLNYLKNNIPSYLYYYILLGIEAVDISKAKKSISKKEAKEIEKLFLNHIH